MQTDELVTASANERPLTARSSHTIALAQLKGII